MPRPGGERGTPSAPRRIALILGDQLNLANPALATLDRAQDLVLMIEAPGEATHVWSHKARIVLFLSAMRHFAQTLEAAGFGLRYVGLDDPMAEGFGDRLIEELRRLGGAVVVVTEPGEWRIRHVVEHACQTTGTALEVLPDDHFMVSREEFRRWAGDARTWRMESFYHHVRRRTGVLMDGDDPVGGRWNYDADNRAGFGARGPSAVPEPPRFSPDATTRAVIRQVEERFARHPGDLANFAWPVTRIDALEALAGFVDHRLAHFGRHQDAMWQDEPFLWHSLLSSSLNLKLLDPREVIDAALQAWKTHDLPLASVEGFVRQVLGWREFVRGVYWHAMPGLAEANHFGHSRPLPGWYWTGRTSMNCLRAAIGQTLEHGYAHHIQRLMITGNFALLAGIAPSEVCDWYLAVYVDAVEWAELPNTAGMALYADGGRFTSKPYVASGAYIRRMSNYCKGCRYRPEVRTGPDACPVTALFWRFLIEHEAAFARNPRTALMAKNVARLSVEDRAAVTTNAENLLRNLDAL